MGRRGAPHTPIFFDNVRVPAENLIGEEGKGFKASMRALDLNRPTIGAQCVGLAQGALDASITYAKERRQLKRSIAEFQGVQFSVCTESARRGPVELCDVTVTRASATRTSAASAWSPATAAR